MENNNIVAFYDNSDPNGNNFKQKYCNKKIELTKTMKVRFAFEVCISVLYSCKVVQLCRASGQKEISWKRETISGSYMHPFPTSS